MNLSDQQQDVEFMLNRCLGLCLTDRKAAIESGEILDFDITDGAKAYSTSLYAPLTMLSHAHRLVGSFTRDVISFVSDLLIRYNSDSRRKVDLKSLDLDRDPKSIFRVPLQSRERRVLTEGDALACALVAEEFIVHCESLLSLFDDTRKEIRNVSLLALLDWFRNQTARIRYSWDLLAENAGLPINRVRELIREEAAARQKSLSTAFAIGLESRSQGVGPESIEGLYRECARKVRFTKRLLVWRERWKETSSGFGPGSRLTFQQTRSAPALFELWSFMELANAFHASGRESLVQCSLLRSSNGNPTFSGANNVDIYFDFHGNPQLLPYANQVLNRVHVEWFLRNRDDYSKSIVLDTKYKASESVNHLTTLGYMSAFQVKRGVIIFRKDLDPRAFQAAESDTRFALCRFGEARQQLLCALLLIPRKEELRQNLLVLQRMIDKVVLA
jgi:hypothetical protein